MCKKYTYKEIWKEANGLFDIKVINKESEFEADRKKMMAVLKEKGIKGEERGDGNATTFERSVVDSLLYDWCYDRWLDRGTNKKVERRAALSSYEEQIEAERLEQDNIEELFGSEPSKFLENQKIEARRLVDEEAVNRLYKEKKQEIMIEALFSKFFELKGDKLMKDTRLYVGLENDNALQDIAEVRQELDDLSNINNYIVKKEKP